MPHWCPHCASEIRTARRSNDWLSPELWRLATGQQAGLFSGPAYTMFKALHAARLAEWLTANDIPAVPIFWIATEDHDFAEVNHAWVFDSLHRPVKLEMRRSASTQPVGTVALVSPPVNELRAELHGMPFGEEVADLVEECYRGGNTMGGAFGGVVAQTAGTVRYPATRPDAAGVSRAGGAGAAHRGGEAQRAHRAGCWRAIAN
ncbi:MAG: bacillithiol biosynthesis BshC [Ignavibacteriota bacterium]